MDIYGKPFVPNMRDWARIVDDFLANPGQEPIRNVAPNDVDDRPYDVIFVGGGAAGRFGGAFAKARGGRPLIVDKWPFLGGSCPHEACVPHHVFSDCARQLDLQRWFSGQLWFPEFDAKNVSVLEIIEMFKKGRGGAHAIMNLQTKDQLGVEYILNAPATVIDNHTVEVAGERFTARALVLATGARTLLPDIPGLHLKGVYDFATLIEDLDYEPSRCVIIGGSKVAIEYGAFFQAAGIQTTILTRSPLMATQSLHHVDDDLREYVVEGMRLRGIEILEGVEPLEVLGNGKATGVEFRNAAGGIETRDCDFVFVATGERAQSQPFVDTLGVEVDDRMNIKVDWTMKTSVEDVYAVGDLIGPPLEMFKARKSGCVAARNIMGEHWEWDYTEYPDFLHSTYEVTWTGLSEREAREQYKNVVKIQMPPEGLDHKDVGMPVGDASMLYAMKYPELTGFCKMLIDGDSRRIIGAHYVGFGVKNAFQYLDELMRRGITIDEMGELNELFLNDLFIQLCRLRSGQAQLQDL
jgi:pyruvate/2-oxoglutarate dehydrogenase complex dihydrolipoamide dehydrogenase (E3) component